MIGDKYRNIGELTNMPPQDLFKLVLETQQVELLREIAKLRFPLEATLENKNPQEPFIVWPAINREPRQHWLPLLLAKVAKAELLQDRYERLVVIAAPRSATWYLPIIWENAVFPQAVCPHVLKEDQLEEFKLQAEASFQLSVSSYVYNRHSRNGNPHGTQTWYFAEPGVYKNSTILMLDDALAEGVTGLTVTQALKEQLGASRVFYAAPMAKKVQGGLERMQQSPYISGMSILINVTKTNGPGGLIEFN